MTFGDSRCLLRFLLPLFLFCDPRFFLLLIDLARELAHPTASIPRFGNTIINKHADLLTLFHTKDESSFDEIARVLAGIALKLMTNKLDYSISI